MAKTAIPTPGLTIRKGGPGYEVVGLTSNHPGATAGLLYYIIPADGGGFQCIETFPHSKIKVDGLSAPTLDDLAKILSERYAYASHPPVKDEKPIPLPVVVEP